MNQPEKLYGIHAVQEAMRAGIPLHKVLVQKDLHNERISALIKEMRQSAVPFQLVPREKLNRLTSKPHQGVIALTSQVEYESILDVLPQIFEEGLTPRICILDSVTDVRNIGAIARSAECFGIQALVLPAKNIAQLNAEAVKSSAGALHRVRVCREMNFLESLKGIKASGLQLVACTEKTKTPLWEVNYSLPTAFVMGAEGEGISPVLLEMCDVHALIPMSGQISSLNVSVAAGIVFYEAYKQDLI